MSRQLTLAILIILVLIKSTAIADLADLEKAARQEGKLYTLTMPDPWANWRQTWADLKRLYGIKHQDTDMTSGQAIAKMRAEKRHATADMSDAGYEFAPVAKSQNITQPYKPSTWNEIPDWAKDSEGHWMLSYTGTIAFIINKQLVKDSPRSWKDLLKGKYKVSSGEVGSSSQATNAVLAATYAMGGSEANLEPGIRFFAELAKQKRLSLANPVIANIEKGEVEVGLLWDFNALSYRAIIDPDRFDVLIPHDGSVIGGYSTLINKYAKHPNAAKVAREYMLSDSGQLNFAMGYARPIRDILLPAEAKERLLPQEQYENVRPVQDPLAWRRSSRELPMLWQEDVLIYMQ